MSLLFLVLVTPLAADPLVDKGIYILQAAPGVNLSAVPPQNLGVSSNAAGWEQWEWRDVGSGISYWVSYHGTVLVADLASNSYGRPRHAGKTMLAKELYGVNTVPSTGRIHLRCTAGYLAIVDGKVIGTDKQMEFNAIRVASPDTNRRYVVSLAVEKSFVPQSIHRTYIGRLNDQVTQVTTRLEDVIKVSIDPSGPMRYGTPISFKYDYVYAFIPAQGTNPLLLRFVSNADSKFIVIDPTGVHPAGDWVSVTDTVAFKEVSTGRFLSCPNGGGRPYLTTNSGASEWEYWRVLKP